MDAEVWDENFHLTTLTLSLLKHETTSICQLEISSGAAFLRQCYPPPQTSQLNKKYTGICCLHTSIFWSQGWINKRYITPDNRAYRVTGHQDWWSYGCPLSKGYATIIRESYSPSWSILHCDKNKRNHYSIYEEIMHDDTKSKEGEIDKLWHMYE